MKIKSDFITNSSTSCYIIVGYQISLGEDYEETRKKIMTKVFDKEYDEDGYYDLRNHPDDGLQLYDDGEGYSIFIGKTVMYVDDNGGEVSATDVKSLISLLNFEEIFIDSFLDKVKESKKLKKKAGEIETDLRNALLEIKSRYEIEESSFEDSFKKVKDVFNLEGPPKIMSIIQMS